MSTSSSSSSSSSSSYSYSHSSSSLIYTKTDEAPALATRFLLPVIRAFVRPAGVNVPLADISLAARVLAAFPEVVKSNSNISDSTPSSSSSSSSSASSYSSSFEEDSLNFTRPGEDALGQLGELCANSPSAVIIKLPNISASIPQLAECITELREHGFTGLPDYPPVSDKSPEAASVRGKYSKVLGSAVNPVLREGNSDRRVARAVKEYAQKNPHSMGKWSSTSKTHVASMSKGDFCGSEKSCVAGAGGDDVSIVFVNGADGSRTDLKKSIKLEAGEVFDCSALSKSELRSFFEHEIADAKKQNVLLSLHLKATMMKISDPIIFGHAVSVYFADAFAKHAAAFARIGVNPDNGLGDLMKKVAAISDASERAAIEADIKACLQTQPALAMVDSDKGITNLHVPSDVIIDASMPAMVRSSGQMYGPDGKLYDTKALIPDRSYAGVFQAAIDHCKKNGAFDVTKMGSVSNVGLMAQKAEEYGSHDKTFQVAATGKIEVVSTKTGSVHMTQDVGEGDIFRMCQTRDAPIRDWVKLAVSRARATGATAVFWLDPTRAHDINLRVLVEKYLTDHDISGLDIRIMSPVDACNLSLDRSRQGLDTISVTGNVLRDYLTDLFPILELGTSAKMLSIVPLLAGGGLYETGAGGSAPKHVQQFQEENYLRWDSLGEYLALAVALHDLAEKTKNQRLTVIATCLDAANSKYLVENKSPARKVGQIDNRGSSFYIALYWAQAVAAQTDDTDLASKFVSLAQQLSARESIITEELVSAQGKPVDMGGYYDPDDTKTNAAMRSSKTFNEALAAFGLRARV